MAFTNGQLAQKISDLIAYWSNFGKEYSNWLGGTVDGGPGSDGRYPLTDYTGTERLVKSPAKLEDDVSGQVSSASASATAAAASAAAALVSENAAAADAALADADRIAAQAAETAASGHASDALNSSVTATAQSNLALTRADAAAASAAAALVSETNAAASEAAAAASAAAAATFDPALFANLNEAETFNELITFTKSDGNAGIIFDVGALYSADIQFRDQATLKALIRWNPDNNTLNFYDRDPSSVVTATLDFDSGDFTSTGWVASTETVEPTAVGAGKSVLSAEFLFLDGKEALDGNDTWLRLNQAGAFSTGVYTPGYLRVDGGVGVGASRTITTSIFDKWEAVANDYAAGHGYTVASMIKEYARFGSAITMDGIVEPGQYGAFGAMINGPVGMTYDPFWVGASASDVTSQLVVPRTASRGLAWRGETSNVYTSWHYAAWTTTAADADLSLYAKLANPSFTGTLNAQRIEIDNLAFDGNTLDLLSGNYFNIQGASDSAGGIRLYNNSAALRAYFYYSATGSGLLNNAGQWNVQFLDNRQSYFYNDMDVAGRIESEGLDLGSALAASATDVSRHLDLYGGTYGMSVISGQMSLVRSGVEHTRIEQDYLRLRSGVGLAINTDDDVVNSYRVIPASVSGGSTSILSTGQIGWQAGNGVYQYYTPGVSAEHRIYASDGSDYLRLQSTVGNQYISSQGSSNLVLRKDGTNGIELNSNGTRFWNQVLYGASNNEFMRDASDGWLRFNNASHYGNGIYTPGSLRVDDDLYKYESAIGRSTYLREMQYNRTGLDAWNFQFSSAVTAGTWYTIATDPSGLDITTTPVGKTGASRAAARFRIWDLDSGQHSFMEFEVSANYGRRPTITILNKSGYGSAVSGIRGIRVVRYSTYNGVAIQVMANQAGTLYYAMQKLHTGGFHGRNWLAETPEANWHVEELNFASLPDSDVRFGVLTGPVNGSDGTFDGIAVGDNHFYPALDNAGGYGWFQNVTGRYGSVEVDGYAGSASSTNWPGYNILGNAAFMWLKDGSRGGIYVDGIAGEWGLQIHRNAQLEAYYNGSIRLATTDAGVDIVSAGTTHLAPQSAGDLRVTSDHGYVDIGAKNTSHAHIYTDRPSFYFNQDIYLDTGHRLVGNDYTRVGSSTKPLHLEEQNVVVIPDGNRGTDQIHFYPWPKGGTLNSNNANETGYCRILFNSTNSLSDSVMGTFEIHGYNYSANSKSDSDGGPWGIVVGGYWYSSENWNYCNVHVLYGNPPFDRVRLGEATAGKYVILGESTTNWNYPQIMLRGMMRGYNTQEMGNEDFTVTISASLPSGWSAEAATDGDFYVGGQVRWDQQSGMNLGGKMTVSTSGPSGGANGDIHFEY